MRIKPKLKPSRRYPFGRVGKVSPLPCADPYIPKQDDTILSTVLSEEEEEDSENTIDNIQSTTLDPEQQFLLARARQLVRNSAEPLAGFRAGTRAGVVRYLKNLANGMSRSTAANLARVSYKTISSQRVLSAAFESLEAEAEALSQSRIETPLYEIAKEGQLGHARLWLELTKGWAPSRNVNMRGNVNVSGSVGVNVSSEGALPLHLLSIELQEAILAELEDLELRGLLPTPTDNGAIPPKKQLPIEAEYRLLEEEVFNYSERDPNEES